MSVKKTIYISDRMQVVLGNLDTPGDAESFSLSGRINVIADRYGAIIKRCQADNARLFSDAEQNAIHDCCNGTWFEPAFHGSVVANVEDAIPLDGLDKKWQIDGVALVEKLRGLDLAHEVALIESIEQFWRNV